MEGLVLLLQALILSSGFAGAFGNTEEPGNLKCYGCFKVPKLSACSPIVCTSKDTVCVSHKVAFIYGSQMVTKISKSCASRCPSSNSRHQWAFQQGVNVAITRQCCSTDLCNRAPPAHEGPWALPGGLLLLWVLL